MFLSSMLLTDLPIELFNDDFTTNNNSQQAMCVTQEMVISICSG